MFVCVVFLTSTWRKTTAEIQTENLDLGASQQVLPNAGTSAPSLAAVSSFIFFLSRVTKTPITERITQQERTEKCLFVKLFQQSCLSDFIELHTFFNCLFFLPTASQPPTIAPELTCATGDGNSYRGDIAVTISGKTCQTWSSQFPQKHSRTPENYPCK